MESAAKQRVLVVDDEPQVLVALEDLLGEEYVIFKSDSADQALNLMERERDIAVVITDQRMPRMTGDQLLASIGKSSNALSIMVTGFADLGAVIRAVNEGKIFAYVTKPWNPDDLRQKVHQAADHFRLSQELAQERQLLHDLMDNTPDGIYFKDRDLRFLKANHAFARTLSCSSPDNMVGKRLPELISMPSLYEGSDAEDRRVLSQRSPALDVMRKIPLTDGQHWFSETRAPIQTPEGEIIGLVGISRDVTERVATLDALRESEDRFRKQTQILNSILQGMGEGVIVLGRSGELILFNERAQALLGVGPRNVPPAEWANVYGLYRPDRESKLPLEENPLFIPLKAGEHVEREVFVRNEAVHGAVLAVTVTALSGDSAVERIVLMRDVTKQRTLEEQLLQSQKMEAVGMLAGGVAHDFNNLLAVIKSAAELALRDAPEAGSQREDLEEILAASDRATSLTRQLLAFSRRQISRPQRIVLNDVVINVERMLRRLIGEHIELITELPASLGTVLADAGQLEQVILNLTVNARDAMPDGGTLTIKTDNVVLDELYADSHAGVVPGSYVELAVTDTGIGMDEETRKHIFEPFFTTKEVGKGTGLGLSTVYGIVQQHSGHIWVYSEPGVGTCFRVYLPRLAGEGERDGRSHSERPPAPGSGTILLVEDDDAVRRIAAKILREHGYTVVDARRPSEARDLLAQRDGKVDLLLTDVVMPETSGPKLAEELTTRYPGLRVLYISGYAGTAVTHQRLVGANAAYLEKPFSPRSLLNRVREVLTEPVAARI